MPALREPYVFQKGGFNIHFQWAPDPLILAKAFGEMAVNFSNSGPPMVESAALIRERIAQNFATQSDPEGQSWPELNPNYLRAKIAAGYPPDQILVRTGHMKESALSPEAFKITASPAEATMFFEMTEPDYWIFHQVGTESGELRAAISDMNPDLTAEQKAGLRH
jgi:hypothetical protein